MNIPGMTITKRIEKFFGCKIESYRIGLLKTMREYSKWKN